MKFRSKLIIYYLAATLLAMIIVGLGVNKTIEYYGMLSLEERLIHQSKSSLDYIKQTLYFKDLNKSNFNKLISEELTNTLSAGNRRVRIYDENLKPLSGHSDGIREEIKDSEGQKSSVKNAINGDYSYEIEDKYIYFASPIEFNNEIIGVLEYVQPLDFLHSILSNTSKVLTVGGLLFSILIIILSFYISKVMVAPIKKLVEGTELFREKNFKKIDVVGPTEIIRLSNSFNIMGSKIEEYINRQKEFVSNVSHEIRTPLTAIKGYTDYLKDEVKGREDLEKAVYHLSKESTRLMDLVNDLLALARMDRDEGNFNFSNINFSDLIKNSLEGVKVSTSNKSINVLTDIEDDIYIFGDRKKLTQVILNVLDNSIKYSPEGSKIEVILKVCDYKVTLEVRDKGIGIPAGDEDKVFDRFYRSSNTKKFKGTGLGLAISKEIVTLHGGDIEILKENKLGTTVILTLPLTKKL